MHEDTSQIDFPFAGRRQVRAAFDAGPISSDGGLPDSCGRPTGASA